MGVTDQIYVAISWSLEFLSLGLLFKQSCNEPGEAVCFGLADDLATRAPF